MAWQYRSLAGGCLQQNNSEAIDITALGEPTSVVVPEETAGKSVRSTRSDAANKIVSLLSS
jgi:hypothetical protein